MFSKEENYCRDESYSQAMKQCYPEGSEILRRILILHGNRFAVRGYTV